MKIENNVITNQEERYDIKRQLRKREKGRNRQRKWRAKEKERRLPSGVSRLQNHPGATPAPRGGVSRKVVWEREDHASTLVKGFLQNHPGWTEALVVSGSQGAISFNGRLNRGDKTFVLFKDSNGQFCLIRFSRAVMIAKGQAAADMFDNLVVNNKTEAKLKSLKDYRRDAWDVYTANLPDRRAVLAAKIAHENELVFWVLIGALSHYGYASIEQANADIRIKALDKMIRRTGNPKLDQYSYPTQSWEIAKSLQDGLRPRKGKKAKLSTLESQLWVIQNHLKCFSDFFSDKKEFSWVKDGQFDVVATEAEKQNVLATGVDSHKPFPLDTLKKLIFSAVSNGDRRNRPRTMTGKKQKQKSFVESRTLATSIIMRATIGVRPSELTRVKAEHFFGTQIQTIVTKTKVAKSVPNPRASTLARALKNEAFMDDERIANEFSRHKNGDFSGFEGVDPKETADLVSYGLRATAVTNLLYICHAADKYKNKFVFLTKDQITYRTSHKNTSMMDTTYGQLDSTMKNTPDPRAYYGFFSDKHQGKYEIKLEGVVYEISKYDTPYDCWLLRTWLEAWAAVDKAKARYYAELVVKEFKIEEDLMREPEYETASEPDEY